MEEKNERRANRVRANGKRIGLPKNSHTALKTQVKAAVTSVEYARNERSKGEMSIIQWVSPKYLFVYDMHFYSFDYFIHIFCGN